MPNLTRFRSGSYGRYQSSPEVLQAIEEVAGMPLPKDGTDESEENLASRLWEDPGGDDVQTRIEARARELADEDTEMLHWGLHSFAPR